MQNYLLIHGFEANSKSIFFPKLTQSLQEYGQVLCPDLPNSKQPDQKHWIQAIKQATRGIDNFDIVFAHSLGCKAIIEFLSQNSIKVKHLILVSGFNSLDTELQKRPYKNTFDWGMKVGYDKDIKKTTCVIDSNDNKVNPSLSIELSKMLYGKVKYINSYTPHYRSNNENDLIEFVLSEVSKE